VRPSRPYVPPPTYRPGQIRPSTYHRIHRPVFVYPRGYSYRRYRTGLYLPSLFRSSHYYFNDYYALGIGAPPHGYVWVRYGPDLLLIQRRTGRIVDIIYGAFY
jgi:Ni/Co efflux regulator RcnB